MNNKISFGEWLQIEREKHNWSQAEFARQVGKDRAVISKIESGGTTPAVETFLAIANALYVSPILLFRKAGLLPPTETSQTNLDDWQYILQQLPPEEQEEIRQIAMLKIERRQKTEAAERANKYKRGKQNQ